MIKKLLVPRSLNVRMLLSQLLAAVCAVLVFLGVSTAGVYAVENIYMSRANVGARQAAIYAELSRYVKQNGIEGSDAAAVDNWAREQGSVNIQVFPDELSESDSAYLRAQTSPQYGRIYPMIFADGRYRISIEDTSEDREIFLCDILALLLGAITYSIIQLVYTGKLTRRIVALSREAAEVSAGDLEKPITAKGEDEIAAVAQDMDTMRRSVIERMSNEKRAWEANSELITAISHDIRTPMTSLLGYLGLLNAPELPEAERGQYTASAYAKAMELKDLTDELFRYFLVFGRSDLELNMEPYDAQLLLEQLLGEAEFDLREAGFDVQRSGEAITGGVTADAMYLKRVLDNLVSNVKKYADREKPVLFLTEKKDGALTVCVSNAVARAMDRVESTKIGLRTCDKIMSHMGGSFATRSEDGHYSAEFSLPVTED